MTDQRTVEQLQQRITLLEQGMSQATNLREMWSKAVRDLKATKAELKEKNQALEDLNQQLREEMALRERMENELRLAQKLESIGQLAAGIAHEINTPIQFISDNTRYLGDAFASYQALVDQLKESAGGDPADADGIATAVAVMEREGLDFLAEEVPDAIADMTEGIERVAKIVKSMKDFSKRSGEEKTPTDINEALETTVTVTGAEWKGVADVELNLDAGIPKVHAAGDELNQLFLNLIINATEAVAAAGRDRGTITVATATEGDGVTVSISDNGIGIPPEIEDQIFDPFVTTKDVVVGAGQGLSIAHSIVVDHHLGRIAAESTPGEGATFTVWLPVNPQ